MTFEKFDIPEDQERDKFDELKEILLKHPDIASDVQLLIEPNLARDKFMDLLGKVNNREQPGREGMYRAVSFSPRPKRSVTIKYFENGHISISGSDLEGIEA